ncbi:MAG TPA: histidinol-phosphate transaminase [Bacteroidales bacterium]|nr:histidinol-phosphate transaminase [Bacteroidales bacterium]
MFDLDNLVRPNVRRLTPYSCARDDFHGKAEIFLDANENPFGTLNRYPDPYQRELKAEISRLKGVPVENIFLGNGSDEIIDLCFRIFCNPGADKALTLKPSYGMYEVSASVNDVQIIKIPLSETFGVNFDDIKPHFRDKNLKIILLCSPNNPTGNCIDRTVIESILNEFNGIVMLDEAYIDFSDQPSMKDDIDRYPNLIVMQTFSKAFGLASVRVGMAFTNPEIIRYLNKMKPPYNISTLNQKTVLKKLKKQGEYLTQVMKIKKERTRLSGEIAKLSCVVEVFPSDANFILVRMKDADLIYDYLVNKGIIVRNRSNVINNCLRITVGTKIENNRLLRALKSMEK